MVNNLEKNKKMFLQLRKKLIDATWQYFEHVDPQKGNKELNDYFIKQSISNGTGAPYTNVVVNIRRGIVKQQKNSRNSYGNSIIMHDENKSEELIHQTLVSLMDIEEKDVDDELLIQAIDFFIIILETLSSSINLASPVIDSILNDLNNAYAVLSNDLFGTEVVVQNYSNTESNIDGIVKVLSEFVKNDAIIDRSSFSQEVYNLLQKITENKTTSEKVKAYVNDVFVSLLAFFFCSQMLNRRIPFEQWFDDLTKKILNKDAAVFKDFIDKGLDNSQFDTAIAIRFLCGHDIQFWRSLVQSLKTKAKYNPIVYPNFDEAIFDSLDLIITKLNTYRNMAAHLSYNYMDDRWLLRCLETIVSFADLFGFPVEKALLEKRLFFERYRIYGNKTGKQFKNYYDVDYSLFSHTNMISAKSWKSVMKKRSHIDTSPMIINRISERAVEITRRIFEQKNEEAERNIEQLLQYYNLNKVLFPFFINGNSFENLLRVGYPFNPSFFVITRNLSFSDVLALAIECVEKGASCSQDEPMIMPYMINQNNSLIVEHFINYFAAGEYLQYDSTIAPSSHFWSNLQKTAIDEDSREISEFAKRTGFSPYLLSNVSKTICLLSIDFFCPRGVERNRDWLRLMCVQPGIELVDVEEAISLINQYSLFIISSVPINTSQYRFVRPHEYIDLINTVQVTKSLLDDLAPSTQAGLDKLKACISTLYHDYVSKNNRGLTEEEIGRIVSSFVENAVSYVKNESQFTLEFIGFLSAIHGN